MPIRNWGGGGDHSDTFIALQDEFVRLARAAQEERRARSASRRSGGGGRSGGSSGSSPQSVNDGAGVIIDGMSTGSTNWKDLYAFYKDQLKKAGTNKNLKTLISSQIENIEMIAEANGISLEGGKVPTSAEQVQPGTNRYSTRDQLTPDVDAAINDQILYLMATGNGIYAGTDRPLASYAAREFYEGTVHELREGMIADAKLQEEILLDVADGATTILDPTTMTYINVTPDFIMNTVYQYNENQLGLAGLERGLGAAGDYAGRMATWENFQESTISKLITNRVLPAVGPNGGLADPNTPGIAGLMDQALLQFNVTKNMALQSSDPMDVLKNLEFAGRSLRRSMADIETFIAGMPQGLEVESFIPEDVAYSLQLSDLLMNAKNMTFEEFMVQGNALLDAHPGDNFYLSRRDIEDIIGGQGEEIGSIGERGSAAQGRVSPGWSGAGGSLAALDGLNINQAVRTSGEVGTGAEQYVMVAPYGQSQPVAVPISGAATYLEALSGNELFQNGGVNGAGGLSSGAVPSIERVRGPGGRQIVTVVWREKVPQDAEAVTWYAKTERTGNGGERLVWASMEDYQQFGNNRRLAANLGWEERPIPGMENIYQVTGADGQQYYVNGETNQMYVNQPVGVAVGGQFHPTQLLDENGRLMEEYITGTTNNGMFALMGPGVDWRTYSTTMKNALASGEIALDDYVFINESGVPLEAPTMEDALSTLVMPQYYASGIHHEDTRRNYSSSARNHYGAGRRERTEARALVQARLARETDERLLRKEGAAEERVDFLDNSLEIAQRRTGIRFGGPSGAPGVKNALAFSKPEQDIEDVAKPVLPPVTLDSIAPKPKVLPGIDDTPYQKQQTHSAPVAQPVKPPPVKPAAPKKKTSSGSGGARTQ